MLRRFFLGVICFFGLLQAAPAEVQANPGESTEARVVSPTRHYFAVPPALRARVNFWRDIFTKYGKAHLVVHHRHFPQIIFLTLDLTNEQKTLDPASFERFKARVERENVASLRRDFEVLAHGSAPRTAMQRLIVQKMSMIRGGSEKYATVLKDDLIRTQTGIRERYAEAIWRSGRYMPIIEKIFKEEYGLPVELTRLPFIESSFDYTAYSSVGAAGIWQFMPRTARIYMTVNNYVDERRDPVAASRGAAQYLIEAQRRLGSWPLALTSYNHGVAGVAGKVRRFGTNDIAELIENPNEKGFGFASANFYPEFLAALEIYDNYKRYFPGLTLRAPLRVREVRLTQPTSIQHVLKETGVSLEAFQEANYALNRTVLTGRFKIPAGYRLKIPEGAPERAVMPMYGDVIPPATERSTSSIYGGIIYTVREGDTLLSIGKKFNISVADLQRVNKLVSSSVAPGQLLIVQPQDGGHDLRPVQPVQPQRVLPSQPPSASSKPSKPVKGKAAANAPLKKTTPSRIATTGTVPRTATATTYTVRKGDTLWSISRKFGVRVEVLTAANPQAKKGLSVGRKLKIPK